MASLRSQSFLIAGLLLLGACSRQPDIGEVHIASSPQPPLVSVTGEAVVKVAPDEVWLQIAVETPADTVAEAKAQNDRAIETVQKAALDHGVRSADLKSDYLQLEPRYQTTNGQKTLVGATVTRQVTAILRDVSRYDELLSAVVGAGANNVYGVTFQTSELKQHRARARLLALEAAKEKATAMAQALGRKVGPAFSIDEEQTHSWSSFAWGWGGAYGQGLGQSQNIVQNAPGGSSAPEGTLAPGQISVSARIQVRFLLQ